MTADPTTRPTALRLAEWAVRTAHRDPRGPERELARRSLVDTLAVTVAARDHPMAGTSRALGEAGRWAAVGHVLDFDDLHLPSTTHVSVVCVPTVLASGGGEQAFLAAAGVMTRLGTALGWSHYTAGWHATCTAGAPAAAAGAAVALGLPAERVAVAMALALPAAGGVQRAFGTDAKSLQVGYAVDAGVRAAQLAAAGASADVRALDHWLALVGAAGPLDDALLAADALAVPDGLATKIYPACYALQRPIAALGALRGQLDPDEVTAISVRTPKGTVTPLVHDRPDTGLAGKFSLEYGCAVALLDDYPGFASFTDEAVARPAARRLVGLVHSELTGGGEGLLAGGFAADVEVSGASRTVTLELPPGAPDRPATPDELATKVRDCVAGTDGRANDPESWDWSSAPAMLRDTLR